MAASALECRLRVVVPRWFLIKFVEEALGLGSLKKSIMSLSQYSHSFLKFLTVDKALVFPALLNHSCFG